MSKEVEINGLTLVPIKEALKVVSYSKDYIARLAREGKIVGSQIGRQWFVDIVSLKNFSAEAVAIEDVRKQKLSLERKRELMAKECLSALDEVVLRKAEAQRFDAMVVTCGVVAFGLLIGVGLYTTSLAPSSKLASLASSFTVGFKSQTQTPTEVAVSEPTGEQSVFRVIDKPKDTLLLTTVIERPVFATQSEVTKLANLGEGILLLPRYANGADGTEQNAKAGVATLGQSEVENLFSDPDKVTVTYNENNQGVVNYRKDNGEVVSYPFVAVPQLSKENKINPVDSASSDPTKTNSVPTGAEFLNE